MAEETDKNKPRAKCSKCGKEINASASENWDFVCGKCFDPKEVLAELKRKRK